MDYQDRATALLLSDAIDLDSIKEMRGRIMCLRELREVNLDDVRKVYGLDPVPVETEKAA